MSQELPNVGLTVEAKILQEVRKEIIKLWNELNRSDDSGKFEPVTEQEFGQRQGVLKVDAALTHRFGHDYEG